MESMYLQVYQNWETLKSQSLLYINLSGNAKPFEKQNKFEKLWPYDSK